jgi:hypothetical protein
LKSRDQIALKEVGTGGERDRVANRPFENGGVCGEQRKGFGGGGWGMMCEEEDQGFDGGDGHCEEWIIFEKVVIFGNYAKAEQ